MKLPSIMLDKSILVTGGAGFIGSQFVRSYSSIFKKMYIVDSLTYAGDLRRVERNLSESNVFFIQKDIKDLLTEQDIFSNIDYVLHFAAESHVDRSIENGHPFVNTNVLGTYALLEMARKFPKIKTLLVSTDEVYGSIDEGEFDEKANLAPSSAYSASKASGDLFARAQYETHNQFVVISRCSNNYGPFQHEEKFIPKIITKILRNESIPIYGDGKNVREWIHVVDHCSALLELLEKGKSGEIYNIGTGDRKTNLEVIQLIAKLLNNDEFSYHFIEDRKGHDFRYALNSQKIMRETGWSPSIKFEKGIHNLVLNFNNNHLAQV